MSWRWSNFTFIIDLQRDFVSELLIYEPMQLKTALPDLYGKNCT